MNAKAGEHRRSEQRNLDVTISARYHWSIVRQLTPLRHQNFRNLTLQQEWYLTNTRAFFRLYFRTALPLRQPRVFARLGSLAINPPNCCTVQLSFMLLWRKQLKSIQLAISFPEPTCLLVSTKTRSSGNDFRTSGFTAHAWLRLYGV